MLKQILLFATVLTVIISCKKSSSTPPPPTPPAKDTSYLRKTEISYEYDVTGKKVLDSTITKWAYDSKGRTVLDISNYDNGYYIDTGTTAYGSNQMSYDGVTYYQGALSARSHEVVFYNTQGLPDSSIASGTSTSIINNVPVISNYSSTGVTVYFFDANGNDTLDIAYSVSNNIRSVSGKTRKTYTNNILSAMASYTATGIKTYSYQYSAGNITADSEYDFTDGTPLFTHTYTYSSVLSGGFYGYEGNKNLLTTFAETQPGFPDRSYSETLSYTFDDANRVSSVTRAYSNGQGNTQEAYTYY